MCIPLQHRFTFPPLMTAILTPLPSPAAGLADRIAKVPAWTPLPVSAPGEWAAQPAPTASALPAWPEAQSPRTFPQSWPSPLSALPSDAAEEAGKILTYTKREPVEAHKAEAKKPVQTPPRLEAEPDFTDDDLRIAFEPIVETAVRKAVYAKENGMDTYLEPMLRATIRRALAEYSPVSRPFREAGTMDRIAWHLQALFSSRTYEEIVFEKTHRFQVEEVFLVDASSLALVSFASNDPARHSSAKRVSSTVQRLAMQLRDEEGKVRTAFDLPDRRNAIARGGRFVNLVAVVRGEPNEMVLADLEFALRRIEDRFRDQFKIEGSPLLYPLQPFLEDCLLIQAPASAA